MSEILIGLYIRSKTKFQNFMEMEKGGAEIIATVLVVACVLALAGLFWTEIRTFLTDLMADLFNFTPPAAG